MTLARIVLGASAAIVLACWAIAFLSNPASPGDITNEGATFDQTAAGGYTRMYEGSGNGTNYTEFRSADSLTSGNRSCVSDPTGRWPVNCFLTGDVTYGTMFWGDGDNHVDGTAVCSQLFGLTCARAVSMDGTDQDCGYDFSDFFYALCY